MKHQKFQSGCSSVIVTSYVRPQGLVVRSGPLPPGRGNRRQDRDGSITNTRMRVYVPRRGTPDPWDHKSQ